MSNKDPRKLFDLELMTIEEVAERLGKNPKTIRNWISRREIPFSLGQRSRIFFGRVR